MDRADACALAAYAEALARIARAAQNYHGNRPIDPIPAMREYVDAIVKIVAPSQLPENGLPEMEGERDAWKQNAEQWARERDRLRVRVRELESLVEELGHSSDNQ